MNSTDSVSSVNKDNKVDVSLRQSTKPYIFSSLRDKVDQYEVFLQERDSCTQYRLISTINPYCTNILFNPMTEIVFKEGDKDECDQITDTKGVKNEIAEAYGVKKPKRLDMIRNTEYSRESIGYEYHPGTDMFNNHILRNTSFKIVNPTSSLQELVQFNTLSDTLRDYKGDTIKFRNRTNLETIEESVDKHLYDYQDIMSMEDSINNNLMEDNGWYGFVNKSSIISKKVKDEENISEAAEGGEEPTGNKETEEEHVKWVDEDFNHVLNNRESCEFIDLYPDRTLFSFNPKYNKHKHRPEYNWNICLTYPYENFYDHPLIKENELNALLVNKMEYRIGQSGEGILLFQTYAKHNLKAGDTVNIYYKGNSDTSFGGAVQVKVTNIGDLDKNNKEYFFYTTELDLAATILLSLDMNYIKKEGEKEKISLHLEPNELTKQQRDVFNAQANENYSFRFKHVINGYESEYYIRIFHKLPNLKKTKEKLTPEVAIDVIKMDGYLSESEKEFDKEQYQLAFSSTIYNDNKTQLTFTDGIDIENLLDNRGRPVSEIYLTIVKNNAGNVDWYEGNKSDEIEYSHCFSEVSCGFDLYWDKEDKKDEHANVGDVKAIHSGNNTNAWINWDDNNLCDIKIDNDVFVGDIVEFNITDCNEVVLEDCNFRFNTYMREHGNELKDKYSYSYDEIIRDDYDQNGFGVKTYSTNQNFGESMSGDLTHPEGYYYKAHYKIQLKEYGRLNQASHFDLKIKSLKLDGMDGRPVLVVQTTLPHRLLKNDTLLICDDERDRILRTGVTYVKSPTVFVISNVGKLTCQNMYDILSGKYPEISFKLRRCNTEIPPYAEKFTSSNRYMWRTLNGVGNKDNVNLPEYPFANGYFYVNQEINFFLRRQDPHNEHGLYYNGDGGLPNDVIGNSLKPSNYEYKEESEVTC